MPSEKSRGVQVTVRLSSATSTASHLIGGVQLSIRCLAYLLTSSHYLRVARRTLQNYRRCFDGFSMILHWDPTSLGLRRSRIHLILFAGSIFLENCTCASINFCIVPVEGAYRRIFLSYSLSKHVYVRQLDLSTCYSVHYVVIYLYLQYTQSSSSTLDPGDCNGQKHVASPHIVWQRPYSQLYVATRHNALLHPSLGRIPQWWCVQVTSSRT